MQETQEKAWQRQGQRNSGCGIGADTLAFALHKMDVGGYRHLPVLKDGKPTGVISVRDMLRHITRLCK